MALAGFVERGADILRFPGGTVRIVEMMLREPVNEFLLGWIDKNKPDDLLRVHPGENADERAAEGMTDQNVGRRDSGVFQSGVKFHGNLTGVARFGTRRGESSPGPIIADRASELADRVLDAFPVFKRSAAGPGSAALKDDGWASRPGD
jgi:hypothetical protein